ARLYRGRNVGHHSIFRSTRQSQGASFDALDELGCDTLRSDRRHGVVAGIQLTQRQETGAPLGVMIFSVMSVLRESNAVSLKGDSRAYREHRLRTGVERQSGVPKNLYIRGDVHSLEDCRFIEELGDPFTVPYPARSRKAVLSCSN